MPRTPLGNNDLGARDIFEERKYYKRAVYPRDLATPIDLWYDQSIPLKNKRLYGRLNHRGDAVYPSESILKNIPSTAGSPRAINFVATAFKAMALHIQKLKLNNVASDSGFLKTFEAKKGWVSVNNLYHKHVEQMYAGFGQNFVTPKERSIRNFKTFSDVFMDFSNSIVGKIPFTKTGFIKSSYCSPMISGLCIEIADLSHSDDPDKLAKFISDPNFRCYVDAATGFGFKIDKNAPWRLVADITSPQMQLYMHAYGINEENLFKNYFYVAHRLDFDIVKFYMLQFYNAFVATNPLTAVPYVISKNHTISLIGNRTQLPSSQFDDKYGDMFVLEVYARLRLGETRRNLDSHQQKNFLRHINARLKHLDKSKAISYINDMTNKTKTPVAVDKRAAEKDKPFIPKAPAANPSY